MKIYKTTMHELFQELDESFIEDIYFQTESLTMNPSQIKKRVKRKLKENNAGSTFRFKKQLIYISIMIFTLLPLSVYAIPKIITQSTLIDDSNRFLIGTEIKDDGYIVYDQGVYRNQDGEIVDITDISDALKDSRIISSISVEENPNYMPASIVEVPVKNIDENEWSVPELLLVNNSVCIFTKMGGDGWDLDSGENIQINFSKYKSEVVNQQNLLIGYIQNGVMRSWNSFKEDEGIYSLTIPQDGTYYFYVLSASSDYLALKESRLSILS